LSASTVILGAGRIGISLELKSRCRERG